VKHPNSAVLLTGVLLSAFPLGLPAQAAGADTVTAARTRVDSTDFNLAGAISVLQLLQNAVPGVQVIPSNQPGGAVTVRIRGTGSVNGSNDPLFVIDGVPLGPGGGLTVGNDPLEFLDPGDIETITVVRDGTAAAYGRGSNGVILITTKSGSGTAHVEYGGSFSTASVTRVPAVLDASQFRAAVARYDTAGLSQLGTAATDWFDLVDRTGTGETHRASLSGGDRSSAYRLSAGFTDLGGVVGGSSTRRISIGMDYRQRLFQDHLDIRAALRGARLLDAFTPAGVLQNAAQMGPTQPAFDATSATGYYNWPGNALTSADNPLEIQRLASDQATTDRSIGTLSVRYDFSGVRPLRGLSTGISLGYDVTQASRVAFDPNNIHYETKNGTDGTFFQTQPHAGNTLVDVTLGYTPALEPRSGHLDLAVGYTWWRSSARVSSIALDQLTTNLLGPNGIPQSATPPLLAVETDHSGLNSVYGRIGYDVANRYFLSASVRRDGSTRFGPTSKWATFPAVAAAWRVSDVPADILLRASWGRTGSQDFESDLAALPPCSLGGSGCVTVDPALTWETTRTWDVGADVALLGRRLTGSVDWYSKHSDDLLFLVPVAAGPTFSNYVLTNVGSMKNTGVELGVKAALVEAKSSGGFAWTAALNVAHSANQFLSFGSSPGGLILTGGIAGGVGSTIQVLEPGQPVNSFFVCRQVYSGGKPVEGKYQTLSGADTTSCALGVNTVAEHDPTPHWIFGLTSNVTFHGFDAGVSLRAWLGNYVYNNTASALGDYRELTDGAFPFNLSRSVLSTGFTTQQLRSDYYLENGSFLRLDDLIVGYTFPWRGEELRVYLDVRNVLTITGYSGADPTTAVGGIDNTGFPPSRVVTGGLTVRF
jgi:TonB-linked SusC/RagA family outer membrane protein